MKIKKGWPFGRPFFFAKLIGTRHLMNGRKMS